VEKQCKKCLRTKSIDDFWKRSDVLDGHFGKCKECALDDLKKYQKDNHDRLINLRRLRYDIVGYAPKWRSKEATKRAKKKWAENHRDEKRARDRVCHAVHTGKLIRPDFCSKCSSIGRVEAHHEDYSRPLDVIWLCKKCHAKTWKKERCEPSLVDVTCGTLSR
jgi:ribosomal protein S27AE